MIFTIHTKTPENLTIGQASHLIEEYMNIFGSFLKKDEWYLPRKQKILLSEKSSLSIPLLKKNISDKKPYYKGKVLDENTIDEFGYTGFVYSSTNYEKEFCINFDIDGPKGKGYIYFDFWESYGKFPEKDYVLALMEFVSERMDVKYMEIFDINFCYKVLDVRKGKDFPVGWMFYINKDYDVSIIPNNYEVIPLGKGNVVMVTNEIFDANNEIHRRRARTLLEELRNRDFYKAK